MNSLTNHIENIINKEFILINNKIKGTGFLEIFKYNLLQNFSEAIKDTTLDNFIEINKEFISENDYRKISSNLISYELPKIQINTSSSEDKLIICLNGVVIIDIIDNLTNKQININLIPLTGITITKGTNYNLSYSKKTLILEMHHQDKLIDIENTKNSTI